MEWYRQMRLQEEQWRTRHEPVRDLVFKEHDESYHKAVITSAKARVAQKRCSATQSQYSDMKNEFDEGMEQFSSFCQNKLQKEVGQLNPEKRENEIQ